MMDFSKFEPFRQIALQFPGAKEDLSHNGTPSIKVRGKLMCRLHESTEFVPVRIDYEIRENYLETYPEMFHLPDHYKKYPYVCIWTDAYDLNVLKEVLEKSWRGLASKSQMKAWEEKEK